MPVTKGLLATCAWDRMGEFDRQAIAVTGTVIAAALPLEKLR